MYVSENRKKWQKQVLLPAELIEKLYVEEGHSTSKIASMLKCSQDTIVRRMREYKIERRKRKKDIPKEEIIFLYKNKQWSIKEIAKKYGCSHTTIANRLREWQILYPKKKSSAKDIHQGVKDDFIVNAYKSGNSAEFIGKGLGVSRYIILERLRAKGIRIRNSYKKKHLDMQELRYLYVNQHMSTTELSSIYGVKACTISARLREAGISLRGNRLYLDKDNIEENYRQGMSVLKFAESLGCSYTAVKKRLSKWGLYQRRTRLEGERAKIIYLYEQEQYTLSELAYKYGCCENTISNILKRAGIARRKQGKRSTRVCKKINS